MLPDFNRLKVFYYVFREQSSTKAAKLLHITQSGVSQHLKKLEEELGASLFTRTKRRLVPTVAAKKLYGTVEQFVLQLENDVRNFNTSMEVPSGELRIGVPVEFGKTYLPEIAASFRRQYPNVSFDLELGSPINLFEKISDGELDFAYIDILPIFLNTPGGQAAYEIVPIVKEEFILACSRRYYEEHITHAEYEALTKLQYIGYQKDLALYRSWFKLHFGDAPSSLDMAFVADNSGAIISAIEADMGIGIIVSHFISEQIAERSIVPITVSEGKLENTIACVQLKNKVETLAESSFKKHMLAELEEVSNLRLIEAEQAS